VPRLSQQILRTDASGMPLEWIDFRQAARLHFLGMIAYVCGEPLFTLRGGINAISRRRSEMEINSIIATHGGRLWFERHPDRGTTFYFTLPVSTGATDESA